ncbi:Hypothetical predicted protein [Mytilus galloprovincialis]|uniref:Fe2OG dioxygenase domain-containing protein n=2 Tax=Mytilus galloprovincialis TaxID=29158 RepID=A0A8B6H6K7_MYTGA|nr:Hypothetical predicted protein [Mytilus galloprovincialis]
MTLSTILVQTRKYNVDYFPITNMRNRKLDSKTTQKNPQAKNSPLKNGKIQKDIRQDSTPVFIIIIIVLFLSVLFGALYVFQSMSASDESGETNFVTDPSKMQKRSDKQSDTLANKTPKSEKLTETISDNTQHMDKSFPTDNVPKHDNSKRVPPPEKVKPQLRQGIDPKIEEEMNKFKSTLQTGMSPKKIFADGRRLPPVELLPQKPNNSSVKVYLYDEFLSEAECDGLMKAHNRHVTEISKKDPIICFDTVNTLRQHLKAAGVNRKVSPNDFMAGTTCLDKTFSSEFKDHIHSNWSYSTAFYRGESRFSNVFEYRVKEATALKPENGGKFQITSYPLNVGYKLHTDCIEDNQDKRDRVATILVYLQDVEEGGETQFPELGIWVKPRKGRALVWNNMNEKGKCEHLSIHQAAKVTKGHKFILQRWYYYTSFYSLGKRPPEPHIPVMESGTPRVSCDEYAHGSCRWYDEWNYDHIIEYQKQKITLI